jgi:hypothetical protein
VQGAIQDIVNEAKSSDDDDGESSESGTSEEEENQPLQPPNLAEQSATGSES